MLLVGMAVYAFYAAFYWNPKQTTAAAPFSEKRKGTVAVELSGEFNPNGVYFIPEGQTVAECLNSMGMGTTAIRSPDLGRLVLPNGISIFKSKDDHIRLRDMTAAKRLALDLPVDINKATLDDLILIPGVKDATAQKLLDYRTSVGGRIYCMEDLLKIPGIKEKKLAQLKKYLYASRH